ncbi:hypothetical protein D3C72_2416990 [compost metagenome]
MRASPLATSRMARPSPRRNDRVLAMRPGSTPCASAASATVAVLTSSSMMGISSCLAAKKARTECRLIE